MSYGIEPELLAMPPRTPRRREGHGRLFTFVHVFLLPHTLVGVGLVGFFLLGVLHLAFGHEQDARVVDVETYMNKKGGTRTTLHFAYDLDGERRMGSQGISADLAARYTPSAPLRVKVLALGPFTRADLAGTQGDSSVGVLLFAALLWNGLMLVFHWTLTFRPLLWRRLVVVGSPVAGRIVGKREVRGRGGGSFVRYEYAPDGQAPRTHEMRVRPADWEQLEPGTPATVLYDPAHPWMSVLYRFGPYRAE